MSDNPVRDIPHYIRLFQTHLGAGIYLIFILSFVATLAESLGLLLVLPLLKNLGVKEPKSESFIINSLVGSLHETGFLESTTGLLGIISIAFIMKGLLMFGAFGLNAYLRAKLLRSLKLRLFEDYSNMSRSYYSRRDSGYFIHVISDQITSLLNAFKHLALAGSTLLMSIAYLGLVFIVAWRFGLMALVFGGGVLLMLNRMGKRVRRLSRQSATENSNITHLLIQFIQALQYLRATDQISPFRERIGISISRLTENEMRHGIAEGFTKAAREPILLALLILIISIQIYILGQPIASLLVAIIASQRAFNAVLSMQHAWLLALTHIGGVEAVHNEFTMLERNRDLGGSRDVGAHISGIELRHVGFNYADNKGVTLRDISLDIPSRHTVALVGPSGAGKSTIVDVITLDLKPTHGQVLIEGIPGEHVKLSSWRRKIGFVPQTPFVFDDTIANNICMWAGDPLRDRGLEERIRAAARSAQFDDLVKSLPEGYQTKVGDRGIRLSGGQRQRLCIARELFRQPQLLILDEATSALDSESEKLVQHSIRNLQGEISVLIVAHRLSTVRNVDQIYVIDAGRVVEHGSYQELIESEGSLFKELVTSQGL